MDAVGPDACTCRLLKGHMAVNIQATIGKCNTSRPGAFDFVGRAKWDAWNSLGDLGMVYIMKGRYHDQFI